MKWNKKIVFFFKHVRMRSLISRMQKKKKEKFFHMWMSFCVLWLLAYFCLCDKHINQDYANWLLLSGEICMSSSLYVRSTTNQFHNKTFHVEQWWTMQKKKRAFICICVCSPSNGRLQNGKSNSKISDRKKNSNCVAIVHCKTPFSTTTFMLFISRSKMRKTKKKNEWIKL